MLAFLLAFVTSCNEPSNPPDAGPARAVVAQPGLVLVQAAQRAALLAALPTTERGTWCPPMVGPAPRVVAGLGTADGETDNASEPFAWAVMADAGAGLAGDGAAAQRLIRLLDRWARDNALWRGDRRDINRNYALDRTLLPTIVAYATLRDRPDLPEATRQLIEAWLGRLVGSRLPSPADSGTRRNNHHYLRGSVDIAWGTLVGDERLFRSGIAAYRDALTDLRADGSLPLETARGARALWYQRHAIASLVVIAEIAANQGLDLYGTTVNGRGLRDAIAFLVAGIKDPGRVAAYAAADANPGVARDPAEQDLGFLDRRGHDRQYMAWVEIYAARFPDRPETRQLLELLAERDPGFRPMLDEYSGGATTCFFARP